MGRKPVRKWITALWAAVMAAWIQQETGWDLFSIRMEEPYSADYNECLDRAPDEKAENARPVLAGKNRILGG